MVQGQYQLAAREDRVLELVGELYGVVRAGADAELAEHASSQVVGVGFQHFRLLAFGIGHHLAFHVDGPVGAVHLADAASHAMMVVVGGVDHFQTASVQGRDVQVFFPVFGVTFGGLLAEEDLQRRFHPDQQGLQCLEEIGEISPYAIHCLLFSAFCGWRALEMLRRAFVSKLIGFYSRCRGFILLVRPCIPIEKEMRVGSLGLAWQTFLEMPPQYYDGYHH